MIIFAPYVFATMATRYEKVSGLVDYAEATVGRRYAYYVGWFMAVLYTPCLVSALAWISARYFCVLLGWDITGGACMTIAGGDAVPGPRAQRPGTQAGRQVPGVHHCYQDDPPGADGRLRRGGGHDERPHGGRTSPP